MHARIKSAQSRMSVSKWFLPKICQLKVKSIGVDASLASDQHLSKTSWLHVINLDQLATCANCIPLPFGTSFHSNNGVEVQRNTGVDSSFSQFSLKRRLRLF